MRKAIALALIICAVPALASADGAAVSATADAGSLDAGSNRGTCAVIDPAADVPLAQPADGGAPLWAFICKGQKAPADGVFGTTERAAETTARISGDEAAMLDPVHNLDTSADSIPQLIPWYVWLGGGIFIGGSIIWELKK